MVWSRAKIVMLNSIGSAMRWAKVSGEDYPGHETLP